MVSRISPVEILLLVGVVVVVAGVLYYVFMGSGKDKDGD